MKKKFNTTGNCLSERHYMMDNAKKFEEIMELIEFGEYFTMNHPRQFGKTTMLFQLKAALKKADDYLPISMNFQESDRKSYESDLTFGEMIIEQMMEDLEFSNPKLFEFLKAFPPLEKLTDISSLFTGLVRNTTKKIVLLIDEVDASSNYAAFLNFLGILRSKYLKRTDIPSLHSVVLVGVHDIKNLKFKLRNPEEAQFNSPWNIAVDFTVDLSFNPREIAPMLEQYSEAEEVQMDIPAIAERLHYHTSGYPFLICKICKNIVNYILPKRSDQKHWTLEDVEASVQILLKEVNTNFDSVFANLENHSDLYDLVKQVLLQGETIPFNQYNPTIAKGVLYGIFKRNGQVKVHNRIYEQLIYDYLASKMLTSTKRRINYGGFFLNEDNSLDMQAALNKFQSYMKEQRSEKDLLFLERQWRLIFLAYLAPLLNGQGHSFKEVETSEEKRLDIVVTYLQYKYIIELKIWRGEKQHQKGLNQLADYLNIHSVNNGYLLIFDPRKNKTWATETITLQGKTIYALWV
ncbi:MAG: AAA family ATPase [Bacteroidota bacterium]